MINHLKLEHFKAFKEPAEMALDGKNVLIYGENGAGKSSLYQALKIIFHRDRIFNDQIPATVTDPQDRRNAERDVLGQYNYQKTPLTNFTLEIDGQDYTAYSTAGYDVSMISREDIQAEDVIDIVKLLKNSFVGIADPQKFVDEKKETIEQLVNSFLNNTFLEEKLSVKLTFVNPKWILTIKDEKRDGQGRNEKLKEYFNEAKLHIIKLLVLLTAVRYNGAKERGDQCVLVLDDVISSMDAANRTLFISLLKNCFDEYQKIILTHSISFYNLAEYTFSMAYQQDEQWVRYQVVEHPEYSELVSRDAFDCASRIKQDYRVGRNEGDIGNRIRKRFEYLVGEISKLLSIGGLSESAFLVKSITKPKKLYCELDAAHRTTRTIYDFVEEIMDIIDRDAGCPLKAQLQPVIDRYETGTEVEKLREMLREMVVYQKVTMNPLSHTIGSMALATQKEIDHSIAVLFILEQQVGKLMDKDLYSI